jgi:hypothetical protein
LKRIALLGSALLPAVIALSIHLVTAGGTAAHSGRVMTRSTSAAPRGRLVRGRALIGFTRESGVLALPAAAPLVGNLGPVAAPSRDRRYVAYNTWQWARPIDWQRSLEDQGISTGDPLGRPQLHVRDLRQAGDDALEPGSFSVAWRADGAIAYARGVTSDYRANTPFLADVVVRRHVGDEPVTWSVEPDRYLIEGWAGRRLIVRRFAPGENGELLVFDGPGPGRPLAADADLIAIDPNGSDVLVAEGAAHTSAPAIRLISAGDGTEEGRLELSAIVDPVTRAPVQDVVGIGSWRGDRVVAAASSGLVIFHVAGGRLSAEQVLHVDAATRPGGGFYEPQFAGDDERTIVTWADLPASGGRESAQFVCDRYALECRESAAVPSSRAPRPVYDPSGGDR